MKCADANTLITCDADGKEQREACANGCDADKKACKEAAACEVKCADANTLITCDADGKEQRETCANGCDADKKACKEAPACEVKCANDNTLITCENNTAIEQTCDFGCDSDTNACKIDVACANANCSSDQTCIKGLCVPDGELNKSHSSECDHTTFVDHCEDGELVLCQPENKISRNDCTARNLGFGTDYPGQGCKVYKNGTSLRAACAIEDTDGACKSASKTSELCADGIRTTFTCTSDVYGEQFVYWADKADSSCE